jgi:hypothetical protein
MKPMAEIVPEVKRLFVAKELHRLMLATLPFPEKVRAVVRLQQLAAPLLRARIKQARVWSFAGESVDPGR